MRWPHSALSNTAVTPHWESSSCCIQVQTPQGALGEAPQGRTLFCIHCSMTTSSMPTSCFNIFELSLKLLLSHIEKASRYNLGQNKCGVSDQHRKKVRVKKHELCCQVSLKRRVQASCKQRVPSHGKIIWQEIGCKIQQRIYNQGIWNGMVTNSCLDTAKWLFLCVSPCWKLRMNYSATAAVFIYSCI